MCFIGVSYSSYITRYRSKLSISSIVHTLIIVVDRQMILVIGEPTYTLAIGSSWYPSSVSGRTSPNGACSNYGDGADPGAPPSVQCCLKVKEVLLNLPNGAECLCSIAKRLGVIEEEALKLPSKCKKLIGLEYKPGYKCDGTFDSSPTLSSSFPPSSHFRIINISVLL